MEDLAPPIVTHQEIQNSRDLCPHRVSGCKILEINKSTILKVGLTVTMGEAEAMILVANSTSVPVPEVLNAYMIEDIGFILMRKIPGATVQACWEDLSEDSQQFILDQLRGYIHGWRKIEGTFFGFVDQGPCQDTVFMHPWGNQDYQYGPFQTRKEFNQGVVEALKNARSGGQLVDEDDYGLAEEILASGENGQDERKILTHGDLHPTNIIINDGKLAGIIDWGAAGYSIASREYFGLVWMTPDSSWRKSASNILASDEYEFWAKVNYSMTQYTGI
jgi:aminoglycoside phosphotransferase (APT) family kinase protein